VILTPWEAVSVVEPVPETEEVLAQLEAFGGEGTKAKLLAMGRRVRAIVPECVGLSLGVLADGLTFTLVASSDEIASLDAVQYLDGGPCIVAAQDDEVIRVDRIEDLDEDKWRMFASSTAAAGIASTLTMPIMEQGRVTGTVNLYASTPDAFDDHHDALADALGASAAKAVTNADLPFRTRLAAAQAPQRLSDEDQINIAVGVIATNQAVDLATARERLRTAAARAGVTEVQVAHALRAILIG
jgi:GAF domain-containing protein